MELNEGKTVPIEYEWVSKAYFKVREGGKAVDLHNRLVGWIRYYAPFGKRGLYRVLSHLDWRILKWMRKKYRIGWKESIKRLNEIRIDDPNLFYHWDFGKRTNFDNSFTTRAV